MSLAAWRVGRGTHQRTNGNARGRLPIGIGTVFGFPAWACRWQVGGRKRGVVGRTSQPTTWGGINRKMLPYCESTEALYGEKRQEFIIRQTLLPLEFLLWLDCIAHIHYYRTYKQFSLYLYQRVQTHCPLRHRLYCFLLDMTRQL